MAMATASPSSHPARPWAAYPNPATEGFNIAADLRTGCQAKLPKRAALLLCGRWPGGWSM